MAFEPFNGDMSVLPMFRFNLAGLFDKSIFKKRDQWLDQWLHRWLHPSITGASQLLQRNIKNICYIPSFSIDSVTPLLFPLTPGLTFPGLFAAVPTLLLVKLSLLALTGLLFKAPCSSKRFLCVTGKVLASVSRSTIALFLGTKVPVNEGPLDAKTAETSLLNASSDDSDEYFFSARRTSASWKDDQSSFRAPFAFTCDFGMIWKDCEKGKLII